MSRLLEIQQQLQETNAAISNLERATAQSDPSPSLQAMVSSLTKRQRNLEAKFLEAADGLGVDVFSYRLTHGAGQPTAAGLSSALGDFQQVLSIVYDAIKNGPKQRGRVSAEVAEDTALHFGYAFAGSVGMVFTIDNDRLLIGETELDESIKTIFEMAKTHSTDEMSKFAHRLGAPPIRALYKWANDLVMYGLGADIEWRRGREVRTSVTVQVPELEELRRVIDATSEEREEEITVTGELAGADVATKRFHMRFPDAEDIRGTFSDAIASEHKAAIPQSYKAVIRMTTKTRFSMDEDEVTYFLLRLELA